MLRKIPLPFMALLLPFSLAGCFNRRSLAGTADTVTTIMVSLELFAEGLKNG